MSITTQPTLVELLNMPFDSVADNNAASLTSLLQKQAGMTLIEHLVSVDNANAKISINVSFGLPLDLLALEHRFGLNYSNVDDVFIHFALADHSATGCQQTLFSAGEVGNFVIYAMIDFAGTGENDYEGCGELRFYYRNQADRPSLLMALEEEALSSAASILATQCKEHLGCPTYRKYIAKHLAKDILCDASVSDRHIASVLPELLNAFIPKAEQYVHLLFGITSAKPVDGDGVLVCFQDKNTMTLSKEEYRTMLLNRFELHNGIGVLQNATTVHQFINLIAPPTNR